MARPYAPQAVLRQLPLALIRTFLNQNEIATGPDWDALVEGDTRSLCQAWTDLPPGPREGVEQMLRHVHDMASDAGVRALIAEVLFRGRDVADDLAALDGHHARALWVLINYAPTFHTARQLLAAASPIGRFWNLTTGFDGRPYDASRQALQDLRLAVARLYREQGRGHRCTLDPYERHGRLYLFLYLDDYTQTHVGHNDRGHLVRYPLRPAFEVVYVYDRAEGTLDQFTQGDRRWRHTVRDLFCEHVLHGDPPVAAPGRRSYRLNGLIDRTFPLGADPAAGVHAVTVRKMRVGSVGTPGRRVVLEADPDRAGDVYDMLDAHFPVAQFPRDDLRVSLVTFTVRYRRAGEERERSLTFDVSAPDACNLKSMPDDQREVGERCLRQWGILEDGDGDDPGDGFAGADRAA
ncbi:hypothetical protein [Frigoriglobus tundricola]|uniref:Uncharacterized protein n=1 Tax=Frigoriglobus tundricola TaxID=2774151 RepID=A0A6M5YGU4_9BACT|nr:hypothetical protein [Frigoriglobus tundricola]QJW92571.1 hypothetical protein FTUN_0067 [Frigoriglobus tundricola]